MSRIVPYLLALLTASLVLLAVAVADHLANERFRTESAAQVLHQASALRAQLEAGLNSRLFLMQGLAVYVSQEPDIDAAEFEALAKGLAEQQSGIRAIQLARDTVVSHIYPLQGNEAAFGLRLLALPAQREAVQRALDTGATVVAGPVDLVQGGQAFISRTPIYLEGMGDSGARRYWGLASLLIDAPTLLKEAGLQDADGLRVALRGKDGRGAHGPVFYGEAAVFEADPERLDVSLPNGTWQLAAVPAAGWPQRAPYAWAWRAGGAVLTLLVGIVTWLGVRYPVRLRQSVRRATAALREARAQLEAKVRERTAALESVNQALRESEARLAEAQEIAHLGNWVWHIPSNTLYWSDEVYRIFGLTPQAFGATYPAFLTAVHPEDRQSVDSQVRQAIESGRSYEIDHRIVRPDGSERIVHEQAKVDFDQSGRPLRMAGIVQDITERKLAEQQLTYMAYHDPLTQLPNRSLLRDRLHHAITKAHRSGVGVALLFLDLDRFKTVNDSLGHEAGDALLKQVGQRLMSRLRDDDTLARLGGDEFTVVLEDLQDAEQAAFVAQRLVQSFSESFLLAEQEIFITCSIGISLYPHDGVDVESLMKSADSAMYRAKEQGRNGYQFYSSDMSEQAHERLATEMQLRRALARDELSVHYQPLVSVRTGEIVALEALVRWDHPKRGLVLPEQFVPIAEDTGLIVPIGQWVMQQSCAQNKAWQDAGLAPVRVLVNLSARQFAEPDLVGSVAAALKATGLQARWFGLEITESLLVRDEETVQRVLQRLKAMGIHLAIDDFGTGHSSLGYLRRFAIDTLKIDRAFVRDVTRNPDDAVIVEAIVAMAHKLRLSVVAEGVETPEQAALLGEIGCDLCQGSLYGEALPGAAMGELLRTRAAAVAAGRTAS